MSVMYAAFLGFIVYRELKLKDLWPILMESVKTTAIVLFLIGCASAFGWMMTYLQIPAAVMNAFLGLTDNRFLILLLVNVLLLFLGMVMDVAPLIVIVTPVLLPVVRAAGMSGHNLRHSPYAQSGYRTDDAAGRREPFCRLHGGEDDDRKSE